ncbi:histone deacetylase 7 [Hoplias malabaricus]|uniref:histone deacetylase 7 n=1 Tax=Hoplias malabaricus TaxID=27720 RepID=UPI003462682C
MDRLQKQMLEQHLRRAREREKEREERQRERRVLKHPWNKEKHHYSAVSSPWVRQKLRQVIEQKRDQAFPTESKNVSPVPNLNFQNQQKNTISSQNSRHEQLRRTASEPFLKSKLKRSVTSRKSPLHRISSAPPTVCELSSPLSQPDRGAPEWDYNTRLSHESEWHLEHSAVGSPQNMYVSPRQERMVRPLPSTVQPVIILNNSSFLHTPAQVLHGLHTPVHQVHLMVRHQRPLSRSKSQPIVQWDQYPKADSMCRTYSSRQHRKTCHTQEMQERKHALPSPLHNKASSKFYLPSSTETPAVGTHDLRTGLVYDSQYQCSCGSSSPHPDQARSVWSRLQESGLSNQCKSIPGRKATVDEVQVPFHGKYALPYGTNPLSRLHLSAVRMAAGSMTELALRVVQGELKNGFAIFQPHTHDTSHSEPLEFISTVVVAAKQLQHRLGDKKILIVDWDIHHGNIVQDIFYHDPNVLKISLHRRDESSPVSGEPSEVGSGKGEGFTVNVAWSGRVDPPIGDAEYLAAFRTVVIPIACQFSPDVVLVSSGFNAVDGHPASHGGHRVSAKCFGLLTRKLMNVSGGRVVMALEGGPSLTAVCDASEACINALLGKEVEYLCEDVLQKPCAHAVSSLQKVLSIQSKYWSFVNAIANTVALSWLQTESISTDSDAASALASLSVTGSNRRSLGNAPQQNFVPDFYNSHRMQFPRKRVPNEPKEHDENDTYM